MTPLTPAAMLAWKIAAAEAGGARHQFIETSHFLIGILSLEKLVDEKGSADLPPATVTAAREEHRRLDALLRKASLNSTELRRALRAALGEGAHDAGGKPISRSATLKTAFQRAKSLAGGAPVSSLHLLAMLLEQPDATILSALHATGARASDVAGHAKAAAEVVAPGRPAVPQAAPPAPAPPPGTPELDRLGRDLTALAARRALTPIVGRQNQLKQLVETLARPDRNNPVLVGEEGVGKTAVVEALAQRAVNGEDQGVLGGKRIVQLDARALLGDAAQPGEPAQRLMRVLAEARTHPELILFVDDLRTLLGGGAAGEAAADLGAALAPALGRGELRLIGATTVAEYRQRIEPDAGLGGRFEKIDVPEPSRDEAVEILEGLRARWEGRHQVAIEDAALRAAVDLSLRFDPEHRLPRKAIGLVDRAAAHTRAAATGTAAAVGEAGVALALAETLGMPFELLAERLGGQKQPRLLALEPFLKSRLVGQDAAIERVARRLLVVHSGLQPRPGPRAVLLFLGPPGVGKRELCGLLAEFQLGSRDELIRLDLAGCPDEAGAAALIGAADGGLAARLRRAPNAIVLLEGFERAQPRLRKAFLELFAGGRLGDGKGEPIDAHGAIFVVTANAGTEPDAVAAARARLGPELPARVDEEIVFRPLSAADVPRILEPLLEELVGTALAKHGVALAITDEAVDFLARQGFSESAGVSGLVPAVDSLLGVPLERLAMGGKLAKHAAWQFVYDEGGLYLIPAEEE